MPSAAEIYLMRIWNYLKSITGGTWSGDDINDAPAGGVGLSTSEIWRINILSDEDANDSDKIFDMPADEEWQILWIWVELTTTADVGDRQLVIEVQDDTDDVIAQLARASSVQAASLTRYYLFAPAVADMPGFRDTDYLSTPIPPTTFLQTGNTLRIWDNNAIAAAADDMIVHIQYASRGV